jgi:hypothetical protein
MLTCKLGDTPTSADKLHFDHLLLKTKFRIVYLIDYHSDQCSNNNHYFNIKFMKISTPLVIEIKTQDLIPYTTKCFSMS